jgi:hypothetical protein
MVEGLTLPRSAPELVRPDKLEVRVAASGFWPRATFGMVSDRLRYMQPKYSLVHDQKRPHLLLFGPYVGSRWLRTMPDPPDRTVPAVFLTGENVEPDMSRCDYAVTFSRTTSDPRHLRCPNWVTKLFAEGAHRRDLLVASRRADPGRPDFCALIARNHVSNRLAMASALSKVGVVDAPSAVIGNRPPIGPRWSDKIEFLRRYRFAIAFENTSHPGYTTEKLPDALYAGTVPLYWGDPDVAADFNTRRFLNLASYSSMEELADNVARLEGDPRAWRAMQEQPAFNGDALPACAQEDRLFAFWDGIFRDAISGAS